MPLDKSKSPGAFNRNVSTLMGEIGKSPHIQSRAQALAIAYSLKRRGKADGGRTTNLDAAHGVMNLTPQEKAFYERHLANLYGPGGVDNPDGSRSTLYQMSVGHDGRTYNVPTVWEGKILSPDDALKRVQQEGWEKFPSYENEDAAESRYQQMHGFMERDTADYLGNQAKADGGAISRLPDHYAEIGSAHIEDRRDHDPTLRAMGVEMLKKRAGMRHANAMKESQRTEAEFVDRLVPRGYADGGSPLIYNDQPIPSELHRQRQEMLDRRGSSPYRNFGPSDLTEFPDRNSFQPDPVMTYRREPVDLESYANGGVMNFPYPRFGQPMAMGGAPQQSFNPTAQLLAQAYSPVQRIGHEDKKPMEPGKFKGFAMGGTPWEVKAESRGMVPHSGYIPGPTGGRADAVPMGVKRSSYVVPSDVVSGLGGGNSAAGAAALNKMFGSAPFGAAMPKIGRAAKPSFIRPAKTAAPIRQRFAEGGMEDAQSPVADIVASHGEYILTPEALAAKFGDVDKAHDILDAFVKHVRSKTIKKLKSLPPPKKR